MTFFEKTSASAVALALGFALACSHAEKKTTPELSSLLGKKIALVEIEGEAKPRAMIEVALVNQLSKTGSFFLIPKEEIQKIRTLPDVDSTQWKTIAKKAGADYALRIRVLEFKAETREGYSKDRVEDSQFAAERGENEKQVERVYKVRSLTGRVKYELEFTPVSDQVLGASGHSENPAPTYDVRRATIGAEDTEVAEAKTRSIHLSPPLRFLERLTNLAFERFFKDYQ